MTGFSTSQTNATAAMIVGCIVALAICYALRRRRWNEFERRLLELMHLATLRQHALEPVLRRAAGDAPRVESRWLVAVADRLAAGAPLPEALQRGLSGRIAPHVVAAIAAADGTAQLPVVLGELAGREEHTAALRYRLLMAAGYPAVLGMLLLCISGVWNWSRWGLAGASDRDASMTVMKAVAVGCCVAWLLLAIDWSRGWLRRRVAAWFGYVPWLGPRLAMSSASRALSACAAMTASGADLAESLRRAAATVSGRLRTRLLGAAEQCDRGTPVEAVWQASGLPPFVASRLGVGCTSRQQLVERMHGLAAECHRRCVVAVERGIGRAQPVVVLLFGGLIAVQFLDLMGLIETCRNQAMEQRPW